MKPFLDAPEPPLDPAQGIRARGPRIGLARVRGRAGAGLLSVLALAVVACSDGTRPGTAPAQSSTQAQPSAQGKGADGGEEATATEAAPGATAERAPDRLGPLFDQENPTVPRQQAEVDMQTATFALG